MKTILGLLSAVIIIYTILCFIDILLSWFPGSKYTPFGKFISRACDPYLNFFSRLQWLHIGRVDFSPILAIGILSLLSSILGGIGATGIISFHSILGAIIRMVWNLISSLITILFVLIFVRWLFLNINKNQNNYNSGWYQIDSLLQKFCYKVSGIFVKGSTSYKTSLLVNWIALLVIIISGHILFRILGVLINRIPF